MDRTISLSRGKADKPIKIKKSGQYWLLLIPGIFAFWPILQAHAAMKMGIISDPSFTDCAAQLTAELSKDAEHYEVLERETVDHVLQERGLAKSGASEKDWVKAGHLLAADGLILLQKRNTGDKEMTNIGWVLSVNTGVILGAEILPNDNKGQLEALTELLEHCRDKIAVKGGNAVPVSVVPAEGTDYRFDENREIFQNGLMLALMRDPTVFVLQREQLETVMFERDFAGAEKEGFWAGANIVQCRVGPDPLDKGILAVTLTLSRRDGSKESWVVKGQDAAELVNLASQKLREGLKLSSAAPVFDPQRELASFRKKLDRMRLRRIQTPDRFLTDTAVTMQALGDTNPINAQIVVLAPIVKACGSFDTNCFSKKLKNHEVTQAQLIQSAREMVAQERLRLARSVHQEKLPGGSWFDIGFYMEMTRVLTRILTLGEEANEAALKPELSALRKDMREYFQQAADLKWYNAHKLLLTDGEYFFDDPKEWIETIEKVLLPPYNDDPLCAASEWIKNTVMQVPRYNMSHPQYPSDPAKTIPTGPLTLRGKPETTLAVLPRLKQWAYSKEPALRIAGARMLLREKEAEIAQVDRMEMAHILVQALGEALEPECKGQRNSKTFGYAQYYTVANNWLTKADVLVHKELLDLSIKTLGWAARADCACLITQPANKEEAMALGRAYKAATERLHTEPKIMGFDPFAKARAAFPEAFANIPDQRQSIAATPTPTREKNAPEQAKGNPHVNLPEITAKFLWWSKDAACYGLVAGPVERDGKLWLVVRRNEDNDTHPKLVCIHLQTGAQTETDIPITRERKGGLIGSEGEIVAPEDLFINDQFLITGPTRLPGKEFENVWMIMDRKTGMWKEARVPAGNGEFKEGRALLINDALYWAYGVEHPVPARGIMELNVFTGAWKFHSYDPLKDVWVHFPTELYWDSQRNVITVTTFTVAAEFDLQNKRWVEQRLTAAGEALLSEKAKRLSEKTLPLNHGRDIRHAFQMKMDAPRRAWIVSTRDIISSRDLSFTLKFDSNGVPFDKSRYTALNPSEYRNINAEGCRSSSGIVIKLDAGDEFTLFWAPWTEIHKAMPPLSSPDLLVIRNNKLYSANSGDPGSNSLELEQCNEIVERDPAHGTVLVKNNHPMIHWWGEKAANGAFSWKTVPVPKWVQVVPSKVDPTKSGTFTLTYATLSPDGMGVRYVSGDQRQIREWRADGSEGRICFTAPEGEAIKCFAYCPNDGTLAWFGNESIFFKPPSGQRAIQPIQPKSAHMLFWSPDGKYLTTRSSGFHVWERKGDAFTEMEPKEKRDIQRFVWSSDSKSYFCVNYFSRNNTLEMTNLADGTIKQLAPEFNFRELCLSADGKALLAGGHFFADHSRPCIVRIPLDGSPVKEIVEGGERGVDFLPPMEK